MAIAYGNDYNNTASQTTSSSSNTLTLGSTGANSMLIVVLESEVAYGVISVTYNGVALTSLGGSVNYSATTNQYKEVFYLIGNLTSGQTLSISSVSGTALGNGGSSAWHNYYFTYGGVGSVGSSSINATNTTSGTGAGSLTVAFNFTPSSSTSTILQLLPGNQGSIVVSNYTTLTGTARQGQSATPAGAIFGGKSSWLSFSDYAPGSTSLYSLSQSWKPNFNNNTGYGWAIELNPPGGGGATSRNTQAVWI